MSAGGRLQAPTQPIATAATVDGVRICAAKHGRDCLMLSLRAKAETEGRLFSPVVSAVVDFLPGCCS